MYNGNIPYISLCKKPAERFKTKQTSVNSLGSVTVRPQHRQVAITSDIDENGKKNPVKVMCNSFKKCLFLNVHVQLSTCDDEFFDR